MRTDKQTQNHKCRGPAVFPPSRSLYCASVLALIWLLVLAMRMEETQKLNREELFGAKAANMTGPLYTCACHMNLEAYEAFHRAARRDGSFDKLLVVHSVAGWGNTYFAVLRALVVALITDRALLIDSKHANLSVAFEPGRIDWTLPTHHLLYNQSSSVSTYSSWKFPHVKDWTRVDVEAQAQVEILHMDYVPGMFIGVPTWWSASVTEAARLKGLDLRRTRVKCMLDFLMQPNPTAVQRVTEALNELQPDGRGYVAIHLRIGPGEAGTRPHWRWFVDPHDAVLTVPGIVKKAEVQAGLPASTKWFVATDDPEVGRALKQSSPEKVVLSGHSTILEECGTRGCEIHAENEKQLQAFVDWQLLANAALLVRTETSTYSGSATSYVAANCDVAGSLKGSVGNTSLVVHACRPSSCEKEYD